MPLHSVPVRTAQAISLILVIAGGVIVLGGLAKATDMCRVLSEDFLLDVAGGRENYPASASLATASLATNAQQLFVKIPDSGNAAGAQLLVQTSAGAPYRLSADNYRSIQVAGQRHLMPFTFRTDDENVPVPEPTYDCGVHLSLDWWIVAYTIFCFIYGMLAVFVEALHNKHIVLTFFAIEITLATLLTSIYIKMGYQFNGGKHSENEMGQAAKAAASGGVLALVFLYVFVILFGLEEQPQGPEVSLSKA